MTARFQVQVENVVGDQMAADLRNHFMQRYGDVNNGCAPIILHDQAVEYTFPERCLAAFECDYCSSGFVVDLLKQAVKCPGCGAFISYEALMRSIHVVQHERKIGMPQAIQDQFNPSWGGVGPSGSHPHPDSLRYGLVTGSSRLDVDGYGVLLNQPPKWSGVHDLASVPYPAVGSYWKGERITDVNRERIHREMIGYHETTLG